jgi:uncharacterized protein
MMEKKMFFIEDQFFPPRRKSPHQPLSEAVISRACQQACDSIAPAWPLDQSIAVNPHWHRIQMPLRTVAARMAVLGKVQVFPERTYFLQAWQVGRVTAADLTQAMTQLNHNRLTIEGCVAHLSDPFNLPALPLLIDVLDDDAQRFQRLTWRDAITHQVSQACAAYFDQDQSDWQPQREGGLYHFWREMIVHDHGIAVLMGLPNIHQFLDYLPLTRQQAERWVVEALGISEQVLADYFEAVLLTVNGWASWCAYLAWQARLQGESDESLRDLLAIRLAWGVILMQCKGLNATNSAIKVIQQKWQHASSYIQEAEQSLVIDEIWQLALEQGYQRVLAQQLQLPIPASEPVPAPQIQAAFCIDVRSEPLRRAIESFSPHVQTLGVAGFFGLPIAYQPLGSAQQRPQLPGLLAPQLQVADQVKPAPAKRHRAVQTQVAQSLLDAEVKQKRIRNFTFGNQLARLSQYPGAAFSLVESAGPMFLKPLWSLVWPKRLARVSMDHYGLPQKYRSLTRPLLQAVSVAEKAEIAARVLGSLGLINGLAPMVLLVGHASQSQNNAHASSLDCGACCGQSGEVNTRALAALLNDREVRAQLASIGVDIPEETVFVAALHNTTTQEVQGFDLEELSPAKRQQWQLAATLFEAAGEQLRAQPALPLQPLSSAMDATTLFRAFRQRANDGAQTRPEWGLTNNAAFIMAPRARTKHLNLMGRAFLHEYDEQLDQDGQLLEQLMTAPMLVTHWINWQYHASTCESGKFGCGNKLLHNVVGGRIGVFEGNGGDLRIGLSKQSLHNGERWMHEPLRLTVLIVASRAKIAHIIEKHAAVSHLVKHGWLHLWCEEQGQRWRYVDGQWQTLDQTVSV